MSTKIFYILGGISIVIVSLSSILLVTKNVVGSDIVIFDSKDDCVPYNVMVGKGSRNYSVEIEWSTKGECVGFVQYGKDSGNLDMVLVDLENKNRSKKHMVSVEKLLSDDTYYFLINSESQAYGKNGVPLEFTLEDL